MAATVSFPLLSSSAHSLQPHFPLMAHQSLPSLFPEDGCCPPYCPWRNKLQGRTWLAGLGYMAKPFLTPSP